MDNTKNELITLEYQKTHKPKIEEVIPHILNGDMQKAALDFAAHLQANKMTLRWQTWNGWVAVYKGTAICGVGLRQAATNSWKINPRLKYINEYDEPIDNVWKNFVCDGFKRCNSCDGKRKCSPGQNIIILGKKLDGICYNVIVRHNMLNFNNPDKTAIQRIVKLLELEQKARNHSTQIKLQ